ncbi:MAG: restriction endonuclease [Clostridia bacterium]|nr:restriction endonuclease [Clostridia bacterium]
MKITSKQKKRVTSKIVEYLVNVESATRTEVIEGAIRLMGLKPTELCNLNPKSKYCLLKSYAGTALNDLLIKKDIKLTGEKYSLAREEFIIVREDLIRTELESYLEKGEYSKEEIYSYLEAFFGTDATASSRDDYSLRSIAGNILFDMVDKKEAELIKGKYTKKQQLDQILDTPLPEKDFKPKFFKTLWLRGGSFFESFVANLLEKYYSLAGKMVVYCEVSGGSDDGGIDVVLEIVDYLGFTEKIKVQTKNRDTAQVNEKEVREFYGAMIAQRGSRGIYVTTTRFHASAQDFIESVDDLVGIDGDKLFELVKRTQYGIVKTSQGYILDKEIFD